MELDYMESDRPAPIKPETLSSDSHSLKHKGKLIGILIALLVTKMFNKWSIYYLSPLLAMQLWLLSRLIPVMIGVDIPEDDPFWANYLRMLDITDYLFASEIMSDELDYIWF